MVSVFVENHNHSLTTPQRRHLLRSHRSVSEVKKCLSQQFASVNIQTHQQISFFKIQAGGLQNMGSLARQCHEELILTHKDINEMPLLELPLNMEKQMAGIYIRDIFYKFQSELWDSLSHLIEVNFNNKGIPCKHIIALLKKLQVTLLPDAYILKIWTKIAKLEKVVDDDGEEIKDCKDKSLLLRRTKLFHFASEVIDQVVSSEESSQMFIDSLENL
ncbi:hypothetical protein CICLE_v10033482mg [Citrus x clementina]|uniref:Uncharacterized protein n=1 Tax=Citrus clementina TaxID=85681 RepID=V4SNC6_CITCL|nr:hypothetical protein CICLE_v10033482mg [Citrus x clementina]